MKMSNPVCACLVGQHIDADWSCRVGNFTTSRVCWISTFSLLSDVIVRLEAMNYVLLDSVLLQEREEEEGG